MFQNKIKSVSFHNIILVFLIPCRDEYKDIEKILWWTQEDLDYFKLVAQAEIKTVMNLKNIDFKQAVNTLYQPNLFEETIHIEPTNSDLLVHI
tara:strand:- start:47751 stop:48029 length:279 start_codon:yes stop_codon:yes gene_type:complete